MVLIFPYHTFENKLSTGSKSWVNGVSVFIAEQLVPSDPMFRRDRFILSNYICVVEQINDLIFKFLQLHQLNSTKFPVRRAKNQIFNFRKNLVNPRAFRVIVWVGGSGDYIHFVLSSRYFRFLGDVITALSSFAFVCLL